jgi:hypothetical protein
MRLLKARVIKNIFGRGTTRMRCRFNRIYKDLNANLASK